MLLQSKTVKRLYAEIVKQIFASRHEVVLLLFHGEPTTRRVGQRVTRDARRLLGGDFLVLPEAEEFLARWLAPKTSFFEQRAELSRPIDLHIDLPEIAQIDEIYFSLEQQSNLFFDIPRDVEVALSQRNVDVIFAVGLGKLVRGRILNAAPYGVLGFHGGDINKYRGRPGRLREWISGEHEVGQTLQLISETVDGGLIASLRTAPISTARSWEEVRYLSQVLMLNGMVSEGLDNVANSNLVVPTSAPVSKYRDGMRFAPAIQCLCKNLSRRYLAQHPSGR